MSIEGRTRKDILDAALRAGKTGAHIAPSLSMVEIALSILQSSKASDVFVLSKGHGALGYYAAMHQMGWISDEQFQSFEVDGGEFPGQPSRGKDNKVSYSSGSLGMGLSYGLGAAMADPESIVHVVLGDGEINEGSIWEAAALAAQKKVGNLIAIVDQNGMQSEGRCQEIVGMDLERIWAAFGWKTIICDGHDILKLKDAMTLRCQEQPTVILAQTIKGKGVSFMENDNSWHHHELSETDYEKAVAEIGEKYGFE